MIFLDTSIWVAAFWTGHPGHDASSRVVSSASPQDTTSALHTLAEVYATITALPGKNAIPPDQAMLFVDEITRRSRIVSLTAAEYTRTIQECSERRARSGQVYDALLLRCARKVNAESIYTWNVRHFRNVAGDWSDRVRTP